MSVNASDDVSAAIVNAAFVSRTANSTTVGTLGLNHPSSGGLISNAQQQINDNADAITTLQGSLKPGNFAATAAPTVDDDSGEGYEVGSLWVDVTNQKFYIAVDVTEGAAVWKSTGTTMFKTVSTEVFDFSSNNVGDSTYVEFVADTGSDVIRKIEFFYPDGDPMILAVGAASSEVDTALILAGGNELEVEIPANSRLSFKLATGGTTNDSGILAANLKAEA